MRRTALFVAAAVGVGAAFAAFGTLAQAQTPGEDSVVGDVFGSPQFINHFILDARSDPSGENPSGSVTWFERSFDRGGPVTCLNVTGNRATIGFENRLGDLDGFVGLVFVEDNGTSAPRPDNVRGRFFAGPPPAVCPPNDLTYDFFDEVTSGDLTVHDAQPFPTSRGQCKSGGWKTFGMFRTQGDCVSFVATKGKNPPANSP